MSAILRFLPRNHLSWLTGKLTHLPLPRAMAQPLIAWFVRRYGVNVSEIAQPLSDFNSLGEFFVRDLMPGVRPVGAGLVSPVDGTLRDCGAITGDRIAAVKGRDFALADLLGSRELAEKFSQGTFFNFYLSPPDYHHIHAPFTGKITRTIFIPGTLWPVNDWAWSNIDNLFGVNERVVSLIESDIGLIAVVMVGAFNVGQISLSYSEQRSNCAIWNGKRAAYPIENIPNIPVTKGDRVGTFHLGSSVVVLLQRKLEVQFSGPRKVKLGENLAVC